MGRTEWVTAREAEAVQIIKGKLMKDLRAVVAGAEELLKATADQTGERIAAARGKAEESLKAAKVRLDEQEAAVMRKTKAAAKATENYVRDNPWKAMGIVAVAGLVLGILAKRFGQSVIESGGRMILEGRRAIQVAEKGVQKLFK